MMVGGSNSGRRTLCGGGGGGSIFTGPGFEPTIKNPYPAALPFGHCINIRTNESPLLGAVFATDKKTQTVCFCLTDCWPGSGTAWLTVNLSSRCTAEGNRIFL